MKKIFVGLVLSLIAFGAFAQDPAATVAIQAVAEPTLIESLERFILLTAIPFIVVLSPWLAALFVCSTFYFINERLYEQSSFTMTLSVIMAGFYFWPEISKFAEAHGIIATIIYFAAVYIALGVVTAFIYLVFYGWKARERFDALLCKVRLPDWVKSATDTNILKSEEAEAYRTALSKYLVVASDDNLREIFDDPQRVLYLNVTPLRTELSRHETPSEFFDHGMPTRAQLETAVANILPPRFKTCKPFIIHAGCAWPVTLLWLALSRIVNQLIERLLSMFRGTFDKISALAFGKF